MATTRDFDFTTFDAILAEQIIKQMGGERMRRAIVGLIKQGANKQQIIGRLRELLPTWEATAVQLGVVVDWLMEEGKDV